MARSHLTSQYGRPMHYRYRPLSTRDRRGCRFPATTIVMLSFALASCGGAVPSEPPPSEPPSGPPGIHVLEAPGPDTIDAILATSLAIEVHGSDGKPIVGAPVTFTGVFHNDDVPGFGFFTEVVVAHRGILAPEDFGMESSEKTDAAGATGVQVRLGHRAAPGRLVVTVGNLDSPLFCDTLNFEILPGNPVEVRMLTKDTAVYVDRTVALRGGALDRRGNLTDAAVMFEAGPTLSVSDGGVVTPASYARSYVLVKSALGEDTGYVSVVPHGRLLGQLAYGNGGPFVMFDLDGSKYWEVPSIVLGRPSAPSWSPDGSHFVYSTYDASRVSGGELFVADSTGRNTRLFPEGTFRNAAFPRYSKDGQWIYFSGQGEDAVFALWRVRPDGSDGEQLGTDLGGGGVDWRSDPSPDGSELLFTTAGPPGPGGWVVRTFDVSSREVSAWYVPGLSARWAPSGARIAVVPDGGAYIALANADGSDYQQLSLSTPVTEGIDPTFDWSPDGEWLVVAHGGHMELIQVATGLRLPLGWSRVLDQPAWQP